MQVPICLAGSDTDSFLTAEPAIVVEDDIDDAFVESAASSPQADAMLVDRIVPTANPPPPLQTTFDEEGITPLLHTGDQQRMQHGVTVRRAVNKCRRMSMMNHTNNINAKILEQLSIDEKSVVSPFERSVSSRHMDYFSSPPVSPTTSELSARNQLSARILPTVDSGHLS